jgi:hypothetical protein
MGADFPKKRLRSLRRGPTSRTAVRRSHLHLHFPCPMLNLRLIPRVDHNFRVRDRS